MVMETGRGAHPEAPRKPPRAQPTPVMLLTTHMVTFGHIIVEESGQKRPQKKARKPIHNAERRRAARESNKSPTNRSPTTG